MNQRNSKPGLGRTGLATIIAGLLLAVLSAQALRAVTLERFREFLSSYPDHYDVVFSRTDYRTKELEALIEAGRRNPSAGILDVQFDRPYYVRVLRGKNGYLARRWDTLSGLFDPCLETG